MYAITSIIKIIAAITAMTNAISEIKFSMTQ
jgi:hypothetical protein